MQCPSLRLTTRSSRSSHRPAAGGRQRACMADAKPGYHLNRSAISRRRSVGDITVAAVAVSPSRAPGALRHHHGDRRVPRRFPSTSVPAPRRSPHHRRLCRSRSPSSTRRHLRGGGDDDQRRAQCAGARPPPPPPRAPPPPPARTPPPPPPPRAAAACCRDRRHRRYTIRCAGRELCDGRARNDGIVVADFSCDVDDELLTGGRRRGRPKQ